MVQPLTYCCLDKGRETVMHVQIHEKMNHLGMFFFIWTRGMNTVIMNKWLATWCEIFGTAMHRLFGNSVEVAK